MKSGRSGISRTNPPMDGSCPCSGSRICRRIGGQRWNEETAASGGMIPRPRDEWTAEPGCSEQKSRVSVREAEDYRPDGGDPATASAGREAGRLPTSRCSIARCRPSHSRAPGARGLHPHRPLAGPADPGGVRLRDQCAGRGRRRGERLRLGAVRRGPPDVRGGSTTGRPARRGRLRGDHRRRARA